jgi:hypothetical protein
MNSQLVSFLEEVEKSSSSPKDIYTACPYSVSKIVDTVKAPFNKEEVAQKTYDAHYNDQLSEYYHMTVDQIIADWQKRGQIGMENGKVLDKWIGRILTPKLNESVSNDEYLSKLTEVQQNKCKQFLNFYETNINNKLELVGRELMLFDKEKKINGRLDALFSAAEDKIFLIDWKNSKKISTTNPYEKMRGPLYEYDSSDLNGYTVQLYLYVYMLRNKYKLNKIKIVPLIVRIGETDSEIYSPEIPYSDLLVEDIIAYASEQINKLQIKK